MINYKYSAKKTNQLNQVYYLTLLNLLIELIYIIDKYS